MVYLDGIWDFSLIRYVVLSWFFFQQVYNNFDLWPYNGEIKIFKPFSPHENFNRDFSNFLGHFYT